MCTRPPPFAQRCPHNRGVAVRVSHCLSCTLQDRNTLRCLVCNLSSVAHNQQTIAPVAPWERQRRTGALFMSLVSSRLGHVITTTLLMMEVVLLWIRADEVTNESLAICPGVMGWPQLGAKHLHSFLLTPSTQWDGE